MNTDEQNCELALDLALRIHHFRQSELASLPSHSAVVGCLGSMIPLELVRACGGRAVRLMEAGLPGDFEAAAQLMGADTCPFCRCQVGRRLRRLGPQVNVQVLVAANHCDQTRRTSQLFQKHFEIPLFPVMVPATWQDPSSLQMYTSELRWLARELQEFTTTSFSQSRLDESIAAYAAARQALAPLLYRLRSHPLLSHALVCLLGIAEPLRLTKFVKQISPQMELLAQRDPSRQAKPTVLLLGSIMGDEDSLLLAALQGRCLLIQATCSGQMFVDLHISPQSSDLLDDLARAYWQQIPSVRSRPNDRFYQYVDQMVRRHRIDAIIYRSLKFCDLWALEAVRFKQQMSVPVLVMDCSYGPGQAGRIESQVQALLEMVQEVRS